MNVNPFEAAAAALLWRAEHPPLTPRGQVRLALAARWSMNLAEHYRRLGVISPEGFDRFERLWAISTATEHPYTRRYSFDRWKSRRDRACRAIAAFYAAQ